MSRSLWLSLAGTGTVLVLAWVAGALLGQPFAGLAVGALLCLAWQWLHLYRLDRWLQQASNSAVPQALDGFWRQVFQRYLRLQRNSRKRKRKLSRTLRNFQEGVSAIPDAIVVLSATNRVQWCNLAAQTLLGLEAERDRGRGVGNLVRNPAFLGYLTRWPQQKAVHFDAPTDPQRKLRAQLLPYARKQRLLWVSDVSQAYRVEQMRRDFVSNASHELRTPLTVIVGYLEILRDNPDPQQTIWQGPLAAMQQQADRMMAILRDLLLLSRLENADELPRSEPVDVPRMLRGIVADARSLSAEREHEFSLDIQPDLWLNGLEGELHSAFGNLVFNAVQHTPPGSRIELRWYRDEAGVHLAVSDDGNGIPAHHLPRLSERFYRVDRARQRDGGGGTGLGLAIVKHVLQRHQGELRISSEIGVGSCFRCDLPAGRAVTPGRPVLLKAVG